LYELTGEQEVMGSDSFYVWRKGWIKLQPTVSPCADISTTALWCVGSGGLTPHTFDFGFRWRWKVSFTPLAALPPVRIGQRRWPPEPVWHPAVAPLSRQTGAAPRVWQCAATRPLTGTIASCQDSPMTTVIKFNFRDCWSPAVNFLILT